MRLKLCLSALLLCATACAEQGGPTTDPPATPLVDYTAQPTDWFLRSISDDEKTIAFVYTMSGVASGCEKQGEPEARELEDRVVVRANKLVATDQMRACTEELGYIDATVTLKVPLGSRPLVGCRPPSTSTTEDEVCRDLERSREAGIFGFSPPPA